MSSLNKYKRLVPKNEPFCYLKTVDFSAIIIVNDCNKFNASALNYHTTAILVKLYYYKVRADL